MEYLKKVFKVIEKFYAPKKVRYICNIFFIVLAFFSALLISFWKCSLHNSSRSDMVQEKKYTLRDLSLVNCKVDNEILVSTTEDPQIIFADVSGYVDNLCVYLELPLEKQVVFQVFYSEKGSGFSENKSVVCKANEGDKKIELLLEKDIDGLRLDVGNEKNLSVNLNNIAVNDSSVLERQAGIQEILESKMFWLRFELLFVLFLFFALHLILDIRKMYQFIYKYRWIIGCVIVVFMTINKLHGDSTYMYDTYVQQGKGTEFVEPVWGEARAIRSDEWLVNSSRILSSRYLEDPYGKYNDIMRGTDTFNLTHFGFASIGHDFYSIFYKLFGIEYGFCFVWNAKIILSFLFTFEFFLILSKKKKILSLLGSCLIICSGFFLWWNFPAIIMWTHASLVFFYYFFKTNDRKIKLVCAMGTPISCANFVLILYPAWQVPMGYLVIAFIVWIIHDNWSDIKKQHLKSWILFAVALFFVISMVASYILSVKEYTQIISDTVYPGHRVSSGGYIWNKLWYYLQNFLYPFKDVGNPSEYGTLCSLFPLPIIIALIYFVKSKKKDWLIGLLLAVMALLLCYTSVGIPLWLSKATLLANSTPERAVDIVAIGCIYLLIIVISKNFSMKKIKWPVAILISFCVVAVSAYVSMQEFKDYMTILEAIVLVAIVGVFASTLIYCYNDKIRHIIFGMVISLLVVSAINIRPIQRGFDAIDSKPLAVEIRKINEENPGQIWVAENSIVMSGFSIACGAKTINSTNTYPNMDLWRSLDPTGQYNKIYNRYEHIIMDFNNETTSFELVQPDTIKCHLAYRDFEKTGIKYIISNNNLQEDNEYVQIQKIYDEAGSYIYQVNYK